MRQLVVTVPTDEVELASDVLWGLGVVAIEERSTADSSGPRAGEVTELWTSLGDEVVEVELAWPWRFVEVDATVADTWRQFAEPVHVADDLVIRPAWVALDAPVGTTVLVIEPGATFGMGDHPTTRLTLLAARRWVEPGTRVLDVGCGSGVLAVGAMVFGAGSAVGVDIAPAAVPVTRMNAMANGVQVEATTTPLEEVEGEYDLILANILAPTLVALAPHLRRVLAPGGTLVVSGILTDAHEHVLKALAPLEPTQTDNLDGWAAVTLR